VSSPAGPDRRPKRRLFGAGAAGPSESSTQSGLAASSVVASFAAGADVARALRVGAFFAAGTAGAFFVRDAFSRPDPASSGVSAPGRASVAGALPAAELVGASDAGLGEFAVAGRGGPVFGAAVALSPGRGGLILAIDGSAGGGATVDRTSDSADRVAEAAGVGSTMGGSAVGLGAEIGRGAVGAG